MTTSITNEIDKLYLDISTQHEEARTKFRLMELRYQQRGRKSGYTQQDLAVQAERCRALDEIERMFYKRLINPG